MHSAIHRHAWNLSLHQKPSTLAVPLFTLPVMSTVYRNASMPMHLWDVCVYATASPERLLYYAHPRMALPPPSPPKHTCCSLHIADLPACVCTMHQAHILNSVWRVLCSEVVFQQLPYIHIIMEFPKAWVLYCLLMHCQTWKPHTNALHNVQC